MTDVDLGLDPEAGPEVQAALGFGLDPDLDPDDRCRAMGAYPSFCC